ncbi:MAG: hypothetical protein WBM44_07070, partial [Waterburya sp.]
MICENQFSNCKIIQPNPNKKYIRLNIQRGSSRQKVMNTLEIQTILQHGKTTTDEALRLFDGLD